MRAANDRGSRIVFSCRSDLRPQSASATILPAKIASGKITVVSNVLCVMRLSADMASKLKNHSIFASIARGKDFIRVQDGLVGASVTLVSDGVHPVD